MYSIKKKYDETSFPDDESSLGYTISVFQDSIGKPADEYLVHFGFFERMMNLYGFTIVHTEVEKKSFGTGFFRELYDQQLTKHELSENEKIISFMNRYFVFKKTNEVDTKTIHKVVEQKEKDREKKGQLKKLKVINKSVLLTKYLPVDDDEEDEEKQRVAIIVPYRAKKGETREKQLTTFIEYMTTFMKDVPYTIFIIEQSEDGRLFNRGKILNVGFLLAKKKSSSFSHYIFHDVDLLPSDELLPIYQKVSEQPIHIANVWKDRYDYKTYFGGVVSFMEKTFELINGFPNNFWGWGGEDDELYVRTVKELHFTIEKVDIGSFQDLEKMGFEEKNKILKGKKKEDNVKNMKKT
jgi:xylosylprotein 4-beta-galactosyltransferase